MLLDTENREIPFGGIPTFGEDLERIWSFALTYDNHGGLDGCAEVAERVAKHYAEQGHILEFELNDIRGTLFFEQRRWRHFGWRPDSQVIAYLNLLLHAIRVKAAEFGTSEHDAETARLDHALTFAAEAHKQTHRKGTTDIPYISHPITVALILKEESASQDVVIAGLLHDTVEDTDVELDDVRREFGDNVARLVEDASEPDKRASWHERKQHTLDFIRNAPLDVKMLSCADKLHNAQSVIADLRRIGGELWRRFNAPREDQLWYYTSIADSLEAGAPRLHVFGRYRAAVQELLSLAGE